MASFVELDLLKSFAAIEHSVIRSCLSSTAIAAATALPSSGFGNDQASVDARKPAVLPQVQANSHRSASPRLPRAYADDIGTSSSRRRFAEDSDSAASPVPEISHDVRSPKKRRIEQQPTGGRQSTSSTESPQPSDARGHRSAERTKLQPSLRSAIVDHSFSPHYNDAPRERSYDTSARDRRPIKYARRNEPIMKPRDDHRRPYSQHTNAYGESGTKQHSDTVQLPNLDTVLQDVTTPAGSRHIQDVLSMEYVKGKNRLIDLLFLHASTLAFDKYATYALQAAIEHCAHELAVEGLMDNVLRMQPGGVVHMSCDPCAKHVAAALWMRVKALSLKRHFIDQIADATQEYCGNFHFRHVVNVMLENYAPFTIADLKHMWLPVLRQATSLASNPHCVEFIDCVTAALERAGRTFESAKSLVDCLKDYALELAESKTGSELLQTLMKSLVKAKFYEQFDILFHALAANMQQLSCSAYGNYTVQALYDCADERGREALIHQCSGHFAVMAADKFGRFVTQKMLALGGTEHLIAILNDLAHASRSDLANLVATAEGRCLLEQVCERRQDARPAWSKLMNTLVDALSSLPPQAPERIYFLKNFNCFFD